MHRAPLLVLTLAAVTSSAPGNASGTATWRVDDILYAQSVPGLDVAPGGDRAAWVRSGVEKVNGEEKRVSNLFLSDLSTGRSVQLTRGDDTVSAPAFSPDGRTIAFLSTRPVPGLDTAGKTQLWSIAATGGEAVPVSRLDRSVRAFAWVDDATLVVAAQESPSAWELERKTAKDDSVVVDDAVHEPRVRLFRVPLDGSPVQRVTTNDGWIDALAVAPGGRRAVVTVQRSLSWEFDQRVPPATFLVDLEGGVMEPILEGSTLLPSTVRWALDGTGFYFTNEHSSDPRYRTATVTQLWYYDLSSGTPSQVDVSWERGLGRGYAVVPNGVVALLADGVRFRPARVSRDGTRWQREDLGGARVRSIDFLAMGRDGTAVVYQSSTATTPPQLYAARLDGANLVSEKQISDLNPGFASKPTGRVEVVRFEGARGDQVEGLLHYPLDWTETSGRRPLVLSIHGGPTGVDRDSWSQTWSAPMILWRQRGAFVLEVNYHGSIGYGLDWVESIGRGKYYDLEVPDIQAGVDAVIARGLVDPDRLGTTGWSNGGILSAALITSSHRFKAASIGAADVEWISDWANVDFGAAFDNYYFGGPPWEIPDVYIAKSPFFKLTEVTTPTLVFTGTEDRNVPPHQSWSLFRALQQIGATPVRLVLFPGEPHGLRVVSHQRRKVEEDLAWFDRYLFRTARPVDEAVKDGSLLQALLARRAAAHAGGSLGVSTNGALVPETAQLDGLEVGRFEVTRAQWAAFDPGFDLRPGEADLPVTGVTFDRAQAYAAWLAARTARAFRLPTVEEATRLAGGKGNTLDRWAGYEPNPDDVARLREALDGDGCAALLLPVGSLAGRGDPMVFDLDGNASEWAVGPDGVGVPVGPSADRSADPRGDASPAPGCRGLRVVVGSGASL